MLNVTPRLPANWEDGMDCMVLPSLNDEAAKAKFPKGFKTTEVLLLLYSRYRSWKAE